MAMVSMRIPADDANDISAPMPSWAYGLCIRLTEEQVEALGLDKSPPPAGSHVGIQAIARVRRVTSTSDPAEETAEGESPDDVDVTLELQITDMEVTPESRPAPDASKLYT